MNQQTIIKKHSISGYGIHSGKKANLKLCPAKENTGIVFQRIDLKNKPKIQAVFSNVGSTNRSTNIKTKNTRGKNILSLFFTL